MHQAIKTHHPERMDLVKKVRDWCSVTEYIVAHSPRLEPVFDAYGCTDLASNAALLEPMCNIFGCKCMRVTHSSVDSVKVQTL